MIRPLILLGIMLSIPGCGLDILEGKKSSFQVEQERRAAITLPVAPVDVAPVELAIVPEPIAPEPPVVVAPAPVVVPVAVCVPRWRVLDCDADGGEVWL